MSGNEFLQVRVTKEMKQNLKEIAKKKAMTVSSLCSMYLANGIQAEMKSEEIMSIESIKKVFDSIGIENVSKLGKDILK